MRIGIYGGTFNPIHNGHLINAEIIGEEQNLDKILMLPVKQPVHKEIEGGTSARDRYEMVRIALEGNNRLIASSLEIESNEDSYTIFTLRKLKLQYPESQFFIIIGADSYEQFHLWKDCQDILNEASLIVMSRPGSVRENENLNGIEKNIIFSDNPYLEISSSYIRKRLHNNQTIRYLVPDSVGVYIEKKGLFQK